MPILKVIQDKLLTAVFQPIVAVNEGRVVGYEALIRGPMHLNLRDPVDLFAAAHREGVLRALERECWTTILRSAARGLDRIPRWARIFLNVLPEDILDGEFLAHVKQDLAAMRIDPARIVIEITETTRIDDYVAFNAALSQFRRLGFGIAVDDAGAGHAGLQMIAEINPDYLKIDKSLVRGIDRSIAKRAGVEALLLLSRSLGMTVIAEGIESEDELHALNRMGVGLGQGYLLARPSLEMDAGVKSIPYQINPTPWNTLEVELQGARGRIGDIAVPTPIVTPDCALRDLMGLFETRRNSDAVVIVTGGVPTALIMRDKLNQEMARPFADDHIAFREAAHLATEHPLIVDCESQLDAVARLVTSRSTAERHDALIVVRDGKLVGTVSVAQLLDAMTDDRLASANHANSLTGLPGHPVVEEQLRERMKHHQKVALVHFDIESLLAFNQTYGFHHGDRAIRLAADVVEAAIALATNGAGKLNHAGGDNFLAVTDMEIALQLKAALPRTFRERAAQLYNPEDRARGFSLRRGPTGEMTRVPFMSLTVTYVEAVAGAHQHYAELLDRLAEARATSARSATPCEILPALAGVRISA